MLLASSGDSRAVVGCFDCQLPYSRDPHVDRNNPQGGRFEGYAPSGDGSLGEARPRLLGVQGKKLIQAEVLNPLRDRRGDRIEDQNLQPMPTAPLSATANSFI
jgi:hypothetical protein